MKKLLIILFTFLSLSLAGQGRFPFPTAQVVQEEEPSGPPSFLSSDGYTKGWFVADAANVTIVNGHITQWSDISGNDYHITEANASNQPTLNVNEVVFDGDDILGNEVDYTFNQPFTLYVVIKYSTWSAFNYPLKLSGSLAITMSNYGAGHGVFKLEDGTNEIYDDNHAIEANTYCLLTAVINGTSSTFQVNDITASTGTLTGGSTGFRIGLGQVAMSAHEVILRNCADNASNIAAVKSYLNTEYSIY